jgi:hypothetical protein
VPEPPDKITGTIIVCVGPEEDILIYLRLVYRVGACRAISSKGLASRP